MDNIKFKGEFFVECVNPDGSIAWREVFPNGPTTVGLNHALATEFGGGTQVPTWYMGLIDNASFSTLAPGDTMGSHAGWIENQQYTGGARPSITFGAAAGGIIAASSSVQFTMSAGATIKGAFITSNNTLGGTTGTLWATGVFANAQVLSSGQNLRSGYSITATGS